MARSTPQGPQPDDFVGKVVKDPANPPNAAVVQGYVGRSDADDHIRVYADPSLQSYVDIPADAVLHSERLPAEQSPLGGSVVWVDANAPLRQPAPTPPAATAADFLRGSIQDDLGATAVNVPQTIHPTLWTQLCTHTIATVCTQLCPTRIDHGCPSTAATVCTQLGCPGTVTCPPISHTPDCGIVPPTKLLGCPNTSTCPPTHMLGCPRTSTCPPTNLIGCPRTSTCPPTNLIGCPRTSTCPPTHTPLCGSTLVTQICPTRGPECQVLISQICPTAVGCNVTLACGGGGEFGG
jgi:hypothetical protein